MPRFLAAAALVLSLVFAATSDAQQFAGTITGQPGQVTGTAKNISGVASSFNGVDPRKLNFTPVNTSAAVRKFNTTAMVPTGMGQQKPSTLTNFFRNFSVPSWPPKLATTSVVPQRQNQFQPNLPVGNYPFRPAAAQK